MRPRKQKRFKTSKPLTLHYGECRGSASLKPFSFVHVADLHLGYSQYGLEVRRQDFDDVFKEVVDKTIQLKPDFMIIAGDLFHQARPSNHTLENTIRSFKRLKDAGIPVLTVDGSHDSAPNTITSTILYPLDSAGLIFHLPRHQGACWSKSDCCYVYGIPTYHNRHKTKEALPKFLEENKPTPRSGLANIFVFHGALGISALKGPFEAEILPEELPEGFCYYAAGHIHERYSGKFKDGILVYSGCTETVSYSEAKYRKGFFHVKIDANCQVQPELVELTLPRRFVIEERDFSGMSTAQITEIATQLVRDVESEGVLIIPVLKGTLPPEASRTEIDIGKIRNAAPKALLVHPIVLLKETAVADEIVRSIFESEFKDIKTKGFEYFLEIFSVRYGKEEANKIAKAALNLIEPLTRKQDEKVKQAIEELTK
jgi:DNA repair protein SbcD/Mre11